MVWSILRCMFAWLSLCLSRISYRQINWMCWGEEWNSTYRHDNSRQWKTGQQTRRQQRTKDNRTQWTPAVELFTSEILSYCNSIATLLWSWMNWIALWNTQHYIRHYCNADCASCFLLKIENRKKVPRTEPQPCWATIRKYCAQSCGTYKYGVFSA